MLSAVEAKPLNNKPVFIILLIVFTIVTFTLQVRGSERSLLTLSSETKVPMLLNTEGIKTQQALVSVVMWFENQEVPLKLISGPKEDWVWNYKTSMTANGRIAVTLSGQTTINKNEERNLFTWYTRMAQQVSKQGGQIYIDERIPESIDVFDYFSRANASPKQGMISDNIVSLAAYQSSVPNWVMAGHDKVNMQLLTRGNNDSGQTVLAIPVLLEEF